MSTRGGFNDLMSVNSGGDSAKNEKRAHFKDRISGMKLLSSVAQTPKKMSN